MMNVSYYGPVSLYISAARGFMLQLVGLRRLLGDPNSASAHTERILGHHEGRLSLPHRKPFNLML